MTVVAAADRARPAEPAAARAPWRAVAIPAEHGGWGLTLEPGLLGLLVRPSAAGVLLALAAVVAFLVRTPLKLVAVDRLRGRRLPRTTLAARVAVGELVVLAALAGGAGALAGWRWVLPLLAAAPLLAVEAWFDVRSRGRRLAPELAGAVGVSAVAAAVALTGGAPVSLALAAWLVLAARVLTAIPSVRAIVLARHGRPVAGPPQLLWDAVALLVAAGAVAVDHRLVAGAAAVAVVVVAQRHLARRPPVRIALLGAQQVGLGLLVVLAAGVGTHLA